MIVRQILGDCAAEMPLAQRNQPIETFFLDRSHEAFGVRVCIRSVFGDRHDTDARLSEPTEYVAAPFPIAITDQHMRLAYHTGLRHRQRSDDLLHEQRLRIRRGSEDLHTRGRQIDDEDCVNVTRPRHVQTSVVKKSAPAIARQCDFRNVRHEVGHCGTGGSPGLSRCAQSWIARRGARGSSPPVRGGPTIRSVPSAATAGPRGRSRDGAYLTTGTKNRLINVGQVLGTIRPAGTYVIVLHADAATCPRRRSSASASRGVRAPGQGAHDEGNVR
jgi:hypothetical protein